MLHNFKIINSFCLSSSETVSCSLQVRSLLVNPSATCVSSTPTTTCSAYPSPPSLPRPCPPPPGSTLRTRMPRTVEARVWAPRWASLWARVWAARPRTASGWGRRRRRRASRRRSLISGTSSPGKVRAQRRWYDEGRGEKQPVKFQIHLKRRLLPDIPTWPHNRPAVGFPSWKLEFPTFFGPSWTQHGYEWKLEEMKDTNFSDTKKRRKNKSVRLSEGGSTNKNMYRMDSYFKPCFYNCIFWHSVYRNHTRHTPFVCFFLQPALSCFCKCGVAA